MYFYLYKITNLINNKIYIGIHKTRILNDYYMGSGKLLRRSIKKYGYDNFTKEILFFFENEEDMIKKEIELVTEDFKNRTDTYNIAVGGGFGSKEKNGLSFGGHTHSLETKQKLSRISSKRKASEETKQKLINNHWSKKHPEAFKIHVKNAASKPKTTEHKAKISASLLNKKRNQYNKNNPHPNKGKQKPIILCPHCYKTGAPHVMYRWHFNNCKLILDQSQGFEPYPVSPKLTVLTDYTSSE